MNDEPNIPSETPKKNNNTLYLVIGAVILCCLCCAAVLAFQYFLENSDFTLVNFIQPTSSL